MFARLNTNVITKISLECAFSMIKKTLTLLIRGSLVSYYDAESANRRGLTSGLAFTSENTTQVVTKNMLSISLSLKSSDRAQNDRKPYSQQHRNQTLLDLRIQF